MHKHMQLSDAKLQKHVASLWCLDALPPDRTLVTWKQVWYLLHASLMWGVAQASQRGLALCLHKGWSSEQSNPIATRVSGAQE